MADARRSILTIGLCFAATILEGVDIQAIGIAAPRLAPEYGLNPAQTGLLFSASLAGLFVGALFGGWMSDRIGRKPVLIGSVCAFGLFSLLTPLAWNETGLLIARLLTGLGLGGAMPNLIALVSENSPPRWRASLTTMMWAGTPTGGAIAAQMGASVGLSWRAIFYFGGATPLLLAPLMLLFLPESDAFLAIRGKAVASGAKAERPGLTTALFGQGRAVTTALVWVAYFCTLLILYLLLNWLPSLMGGKGLTRTDAALTSSFFNIGGVFGALALGALLRIAPRGLVLSIVYAGIAIGLAALALVGGSPAAAMVAAFASGVFTNAGPFVLYGVTPEIYPIAIRGVAIGVAIAVGRVGSIVGPLVAGQLLSAGYSVRTLLFAALPLVAIAAAAALLLASKPRGAPELETAPAP